MRYWLVRWGETVRLSEKCKTAAQACHSCFGVVDAGMQAKDLGTRVEAVRVEKKLQAHIQSTEGWITIQKGVP